MNRVGLFEKVSPEQYIEGMVGCLEEWTGENPQRESDFNDFVRDSYNNIPLPERKTAGSAGYDITACVSFSLAPGDSMRVPTGLRVKIDEGWMLTVYPRSGLGFKYRLQLDNTVGIVDSDYYNSDNEGHIFLKVTNDSKTGKTVAINAGDRIAQAIFVPFGITYDDHAQGDRNGGFGSTGK